MLRPTGFGRAKQSSENPLPDESRPEVPSPMFTSAVTPEAIGFPDHEFSSSMSTRPLRLEPAEFSRTLESGGLRLLPSPSLTRAVPQEAVNFSSIGDFSPRFTGALTTRNVEIPRTVEIGGFLYQRVDSNLRENAMNLSDGHHGGPSSGSMPLLLQQPQERLPNLDREQSRVWSSSGVQLDREVQRIDHGCHQQNIHKPGLSQVQQNIESDFAAAQDAVSKIQQDSQVPSTSQVLSYAATSIDMQLNGAPSAQPTVRKPKFKSRMLRELEPHNESPEPESEPAPETIQSFTTGFSQSALPKPKRTLKMLRELEDYNEAPGPDSESEQEHLQPRTARSSKPASSKPRREPLMLREIEAHNQSPQPESEAEIETLSGLKDDRPKVRLTRSARKSLLDFVKNKPPTPRKNLNLGSLMLAELSGAEKGTKASYAEDSSNLGPSSYQRQQEYRKEVNFQDEEADEEEDPSSYIKTNGRSHPQLMSTSPTMLRQGMKSRDGSLRDQNLAGELAGELAWLTWDNQKARIHELVSSPRYNPHPSQHETDAQGREKPAYHVTADIPEGHQGAFRMEKGLHVFTPTAAAFSDFGRFLKDVEEIAGRKMGVVKVIVPSELLSPVFSPGRSELPESPVIKTMKVSISLNQDATAEPSKIYDMLTTDDSTSLGADEWLHMIQQDKDGIIKKRAISPEAISCNDVWKENHVLKPYEERRMIRHSEKQDVAVLCALNEPATPILRAALNCKNPNIEDFLGNRFASSRSIQSGINLSVFHIADGPGPLSPLQTNKYAAYSLNYHHSGAPRILTVTLPEHHAKLEEFVHITQDSGNLLGRPPKPPTCSQFVAHQPMYVPHATLSFYDVNYTEVVQHQGEMVITFPYAYHQAYTSGPNITEEILYASDRCKVFHRENIYQHCTRSCAGGQPDDFDLKFVFSKTLSSPRSGHRRRSGLECPSASLSPCQTSEASTSQERDNDGRPSKRLSGLKAMDRVSDDGDWIDPSAQASRIQPSTHRKASRMTSNPYEPDMWDTDHAFGHSHDPSDNDDGSPIGGIRPRDAVTGRLLMPHEWRISKTKRGDESDESPLKHSRHN